MSPRPTPDPALLATLERYYDEAPRAAARTEEVGPFTLFLRNDPRGWPYYARPRLGHPGPFTADDVQRVLERQRELGVPRAIEWVHETTPQLAAAVRRSGLVPTRHPLMVVGELTAVEPPSELRCEIIGPEHPQLGAVLAAISAAFGETDEVGQPRSGHAVEGQLTSGSYRLVGAFGSDGVVGGGSHSPRGRVTELTGIAVLPSARGRGVGAAITAALVADAGSCGVSTVFLSAGSERVAAIYARVGFIPVATACIAEDESG